MTIAVIQLTNKDIVVVFNVTFYQFQIRKTFVFFLQKQAIKLQIIIRQTSI
jgi:hypothetical protein